MTKMFRYSHGYYGGGIIEVDVCPTITIANWEWNNLIYEEDGISEDSPGDSDGIC